MTDSSDTSSQAQPNLATYSSGFTIGGQGPIDLTTIFTPPPSCLSTVTYDGTSFWEGGLVQTGDQNCFPPSFTDIFKSYYSPGICPSGWTSAGSVGQFTQDNGVPGTHIFCCPSVSEYRAMLNHSLSLIWTKGVLPPLHRGGKSRTCLRQSFPHAFGKSVFHEYKSRGPDPSQCRFDHSRSQNRVGKYRLCRHHRNKIRVDRFGNFAAHVRSDQ